jgi:hypothetical protein
MKLKELFEEQLTAAEEQRRRDLYERWKKLINMFRILKSLRRKKRRMTQSFIQG